MAVINGGELVVRTLEALGVDVIFGLHGAHIDTVFQACLDHDLPIVDTRHEAAAGHAAEGFARASGKLGVALVTAGGGLTNAMTPIANAFLDRTPVLFIAGSGALNDDETNTLQAGIDQVALASPVTKWAHRVVSTDHIPRLVQQAVRTALTAPRGPVLLDIPWDILTSQVEEESVSIPPQSAPSAGAVPNSADLRITLETLRSAEKPIIIVGSEARSPTAARALAELCHISGIPVFSDSEGLSVLREVKDELHGGLLQGLYGFARDGADPDAVLMLGLRFGLSTVHGSGQLIPTGASVVQIDADGRELGRLQSISHGIVADPSASIEALLDAARQLDWRDNSAWSAIVKARINDRRDLIAAQADGKQPLHPFRASEVIGQNISDNVTIVADGALTYLWLGEVLSKARPSKYLCHGYLGSMGVGFGTAVGAQVSDMRSGRRTVLVTGDGSVGFSLAEFDTLVRKQIPLVVVVMNNQSWGATLHFQQLAVGANRVTNTRLENGSYHEVAKALGADGYFVEDAEDFAKALSSALANNRPACINVMVRLDAIPPEELILIGMDPFAAPAAQG